MGLEREEDLSSVAWNAEEWEGWEERRRSSAESGGGGVRGISCNEHRDESSGGA